MTNRTPSPAAAQVALKSSGDTLSRNSLNFSTSSSRTAPVRLLVALVGDQQAGLGQHRLLDVDRHADPQRDGHRVRRARRHLDVAVEDQVGVEGALLQVDDPHLLERMPKRGNEIPDQIVGQRPGRLDALLLQRDGRGLGLADPDRQIAVAVGLPQQQNRLVLRLFDANADHTNLTHLCLPSARPSKPVEPSLVLSDPERRARPT